MKYGMINKKAAAVTPALVRRVLEAGLKRTISNNAKTMDRQ